MKTLYDLLEALPDDDADGLRAAFRKAAKANHPDFNPGNAEASERFQAYCSRQRHPERWAAASGL